MQLLFHSQAGLLARHGAQPPYGAEAKPTKQEGRDQGNGRLNQQHLASECWEECALYHTK